MIRDLDRNTFRVYIYNYRTPHLVNNMPLQSSSLPVRMFSFRVKSRVALFFSPIFLFVWQALVNNIGPTLNSPLTLFSSFLYLTSFSVFKIASFFIQSMSMNVPFPMCNASQLDCYSFSDNNQQISTANRGRK